MPRRARISFENAFFHVYNRGVEKRAIFHTDADYHRFLTFLQNLSIKKRYDHAVYSYILMPNHFHILLQTRKTPIAKIMSSLLTSYSMYFNLKNNRVGSLFQNRFKSKLCDKDEYFLVASRYIHLNPVAAGLVKDVSEYRWSSYQEIFGTSQFSIVDKDEVRRLIGDTNREKASYQNYILEGQSQLWEELTIQCSMDRDVEGAPLFNTLSQKKYLRRKKRRL